MRRQFTLAIGTAAACGITLLSGAGPAHAADGLFAYMLSSGNADALLDPEDGTCHILSDDSADPVVLALNDTDTFAYLFDNLLCDGDYLSALPPEVANVFSPDLGLKTVQFGTPD